MPRQASSTTGVVVAMTMAPQMSPSTIASAATTMGLVELYRAHILGHRELGSGSSTNSDTRALQRCARHQESDGFAADRRFDDADDLAFEHDGNAITERVDLVELGAHDERAIAAIAVVHDLAVHV